MRHAEDTEKAFLAAPIEADKLTIIVQFAICAIRPGPY